MSSLREELRSIGLEAGLVAVGFTSAAPFDHARRKIEQVVADGRHDTMAFTFANPSRSTDPSRVLPNARSVISGAWPYSSTAVQIADGADQNGNPNANAVGDVASYAWRDHYTSTRNALSVIAERLTSHGWSTAIRVDSNDMADRAAAIRSGVGWEGKNSNVLVPGHGSWCVLGTLITDAPLEPDVPAADDCGPCTRCIDQCPTAAIVEPGVVDARRCLAWLVQAGGTFPTEFRKALGTRIYGCDTCQEVCPPSRNNDTPPVGDEISSRDLVELLELTDQELLATVGAWYITDRDPDVVRRNALVALGNRQTNHGDDPDDSQARAAAHAVLERYARGESAMLAEHADWALAQVHTARR